MWDIIGPSCAAAGGYNTTFKIQREISLWEQVKQSLMAGYIVLSPGLLSFIDPY